MPENERLQESTGMVFDIQRFCLEDGPGIRTTVFLKGCNMRCQWCHNPEGFRKGEELSFQEWKCVHCGLCQKLCPSQVHTVEHSGHHLERTRCTACGLCCQCPSEALKVFGSRMTSGEVVSQICKDREYYEESGGGVTFSGGEATLQTEFLIDMLLLCKKEGISTAVETNGCVEGEILEKISVFTDLFLLTVYWG